MTAHDYETWKRLVWQRPLRSGLAGLLLVLTSVTVTIAGVIVAAVVFHHSGAVRAPWAKTLAVPLAGLGAAAFFLLRPLAWRFTRAYREQRDRTLLDRTLPAPDGDDRVT